MKPSQSIVTKVTKHASYFCCLVVVVNTKAAAVLLVTNRADAIKLFSQNSILCCGQPVTVTTGRIVTVAIILSSAVGILFPIQPLPCGVVSA